MPSNPGNIIFLPRRKFNNLKEKNNFLHLYIRYFEGLIRVGNIGLRIAGGKRRSKNCLNIMITIPATSSSSARNFQLICA